jgi:hypothetical protein
MSPELERLLAALYERDTCEPSQRAQREATFRRLVDEALARKTGLSSHELMEAIHWRYVEFRRSRASQQLSRQVHKGGVFGEATRL